MARKKNKKKDPDLLSKIEAMQQQMQALIKEFKNGVDDADTEDQANGRGWAPREPLDADLIDKVRRLTQARPMFFLEIVTETGQDENKIKAVLTKMRRDGEPLINFGKLNRALWYHISPRDASRVMQDLVELGVKAGGLDDASV